MNSLIPLCELHTGERGIVGALQTTGSMRRRMLDIGLIENTPVECVGRSPAGDPIAFLIRGAVIALRHEDCQSILIRRG